MFMRVSTFLVIFAATSCGQKQQSSLQELKAIESISLVSGIAAWNDKVSAHAEKSGRTGLQDNYTECAPTQEIDGGYLCASYRVLTMNKAMARASLFTEGNLGAPKGQVLPQNNNSVLNGIRNIGGHDLRSVDLLRFWNAAQQLCTIHKRDSNYCPSVEEQEFFSGFVVPLSKRVQDFVVISYALQSHMDYMEVVTHEVLHAQYFLQPKFREVADAFWHTSVDENDKKYVKRVLADYYDANDELLMMNEFQAYMLMAGAEQNLLSRFVAKYRPALMAKLQEVGLSPIQIN